MAKVVEVMLVLRDGLFISKVVIATFLISQSLADCLEQHPRDNVDVPVKRWAVLPHPPYILDLAPSHFFVVGAFRSPSVSEIWQWRQESCESMDASMHT